jgi:RNA polymerase sigma factor (sigma-70 family)
VAIGDGELVEAARAGDRRAFGELLGRHTARARAVVRALVGAEDAEDVVQEAALCAYLDLSRLREPDRFGGWLCAIAVNLARMRLRRRDATVAVEDWSGGLRVPPGLASADLSPEEAIEARETLELVRRAIAILPDGQREAVLMHYVEGLSCQEIAALCGQSTGAVRVRLHRARAQLRERLLGLDGTRTAEAGKELSKMIEVTLEDVVVRVVEGEIPEGELPRLANERMRVVLLRERDGERRLPIWIGAFEGDALALHLGGESMPRPLTADLMARLVEATGGRIEHVRISSLRDKTFYAVVAVKAGDRLEELDARPSDALNLAARVGAPIFVDEEVLDQAGVLPDALEPQLETTPFGDEAEPGRWRSLSPELVLSLHPPPKP